jgi:hypothetical protein
MSDKVAFFLLILGMVPILFWTSKFLVHILLIKFFGFNCTYQTTDGNKVSTKKVRLNSKTSYEELMAIKKEMAK